MGGKPRNGKLECAETITLATRQRGQIVPVLISEKKSGGATIGKMVERRQESIM